VTSSRPVLVTGLPRSGTSWVGKMLELSGALVYVNEPMNPSHPPGRSPGVLDAEVEHYFHYICPDNDRAWRRAFGDTLGLRYRLLAELRRNHRPYDLARAAKYQHAFWSGRRHDRAALLDDPYAVFSAGWLADHMDVRVVILVRDPVTFVGSWRALGWSVDPAELLFQPLLMRDHLEPFRAELEELAGSDDWLASACLVWRATYHVVGRVAAERPSILVRRYESFAADPIRSFESLYGELGLPWQATVEDKIRAATTSGPVNREGFRWSIRGGAPSRTAFQPMDSRASLARAAARLDADQVARVLELTSDVRTAFYGPAAADQREPDATPS
jgi:Sulfotransferase family